MKKHFEQEHLPKQGLLKSRSLYRGNFLSLYVIMQSGVVLLQRVGAGLVFEALNTRLLIRLTVLREL